MSSVWGFRNNKTSLGSVTYPAQTVAPVPPSTWPPKPWCVPAANVGNLLLNHNAQEIFNHWSINTSQGAACVTPVPMSVQNMLLMMNADGRDGHFSSIQSGPYNQGFITEAKIKLPGTTGTLVSPSGQIPGWPAYYANGTPWPVAGEFDAMECMGGGDGMSWHYGSGDTSVALGNPPVGPGWHYFTWMWKAGQVASWHDGMLDVSYVSSHVVGPQGAWITLVNTNGQFGLSTGKPSVMEVAYVRVWTAR